MTTDTIQLARQKYADGEHKQAHVLLVKAIYDTGLKDELLAELQRLFPADPELLKKLEDYEQRLSATDLKTRQKAAKELSRLALGELSNTTFDFLRHPETMTLLIGQLANSDAVVQENIVITLAMAFQRYTRDMRAFAPLVEKLSSKSVNTRAWAATGLIDLTEESVEHVLPLVADKSERVWKAVTSELTAALDGGGILSQSPIGLRNRRKIRDAMLLADRNRDAEFRITVASLLFRTAEPQDIPAMQLWVKKDGSKFVKQFLKDAIERLQNQPLPPETESPSLESVAPAPSVTSPSLTSHPTQKKSPLAPRVAAEEPHPEALPPKTGSPSAKVETEQKPRPPSKRARKTENSEYAPCLFVAATSDGPHSVTFDDFNATADTFEELDREGGGYDWHAVVGWLVRSEAPQLKKKLTYDHEASRPTDSISVIRPGATAKGYQKCQPQTEGLTIVWVSGRFGSSFARITEPQPINLNCLRIRVRTIANGHIPSQRSRARSKRSEKPRASLEVSDFERTASDASEFRGPCPIQCTQTHDRLPERCEVNRQRRVSCSGY